jgi:hypothetical protein
MQCNSPFPCICLSIYRLGPNAHQKISELGINALELNFEHDYV